MILQMAVFGACRCCEVGPGPCTCAQMAAQMIQDIARLNNEVGYWHIFCSGVASYGALGHVSPLDFQRFHFSFTLE